MLNKVEGNDHLRLNVNELNTLITEVMLIKII